MLSKRIFESAIPTLVVLFASVFLFTPIAYAQGVEVARPLSVNEQIIQDRINKNSQKATLLDATSGNVDKLEEKKDVLNAKLESEKQKIADLKQQIAQKKAEEARIAQQARQVVTRTVSYAPPAPQGNCGDNSYAAYIYGMESGGRVPGNCNPTARNAGGCYGIGQACPGSKVAHCGADYACQNAWFTNYAMQRYGSWVAAYNFHRANGWW